MKNETLSLSAVGQSLISWKDWFLTRRQGQGKPFFKKL